MVRIVKPGKPLKFRFEVEGEPCYVSVKVPEDTTLKAFLNNRFDTGKRGKLKDNSVEAAEKFVEKILHSTENIEDVNEQGDVVPMDSMPNWKKDIPLNWKLAIAAHFMEAETDLVNG